MKQIMQDDRPHVAMLEDDHERISRFAAVLSKSFRFLYWRTAHDFIGSFPNFPKPGLIALDHDLFVDHPGDPDPGDGRDVSNYLASIEPVAPVLIHSTNSHAADSMLYQLRDSGWNADRISPLGEDWIESDWFPFACELYLRNSPH